ncbi:hypothetical protein CO724_14210 [Ectopseudomonas mendocina]|nr:hypothetical protein CO724_14210 [Pseudomonas mendocina]
MFTDALLIRSVEICDFDKAVNSYSYQFRHIIGLIAGDACQAMFKRPAIPIIILQFEQNGVVDVLILKLDSNAGNVYFLAM